MRSVSIPALLLAWGGCVCAQSLYQRHIRPVLEKQCMACHNPTAKQAGLDLSTRDKMLCGGERGPCACLGCVQVGNRRVMVELITGEPFSGDAEWVDERRIPDEIYKECKISRPEWDAWMERQG